MPEDAFLALEDLAFGTAPGVRDLLPGSPGGYPPLGIALGGIVDPVTFETYPSGRFNSL